MSDGAGSAPDLRLDPLLRRRARAAPPIRLAARDLQNKWGFEDGDAVHGWMREHLPPVGQIARRLGVRPCFDDVADRLGVGPKAATALAVAGFLVPRIEEALEVVLIPTVHNPLITRTVGGAPIAYREPDRVHPVTPEAVTVDGEAVWEILRLTRAPALRQAERAGVSWEERRHQLARLIPGALEVGVRRGALGKDDLVRCLHSSGPLMGQAALRLLARASFPGGDEVRIDRDRAGSRPKRRRPDSAAADRPGRVSPLPPPRAPCRP